MIPVVVDSAWLAAHPDAVVADVRHKLGKGPQRDAYLAGHLPGATFVDLDAALAATPSAEGGRHPLPEPAAFAEAMAAAGIGEDDVVVAYDDAGGAFAARLVWLLRLAGVDAALLDGGLQGWDGDLPGGAVERPAATFGTRPWDPGLLATIDDASTAPIVVDARAGERYRGESEPMDARAGHIPGAVNLPFAENLGPDGRFAEPEQLRRRFVQAGITDAAGIVVYCGSGVTACHNLIALEHAGLGRAQLYPGSWSQYAGTERPVATGAEPGSRPSVDPHGVTH